ncbi:MAG: hypothetical protein ABIG73_02290 [Patescibacteria group bacterium]
MNKKIIMAVIITLIIAGGGGFYNGMLYGKSARPDLSANMNRQRINGAQQNGGFSGGEIIKKDSNSITVKLTNGSSQIILFSDTTKIMKSAEGVAADLTIGEQVTITGPKNQDGSITVQSIQIRPAMPTN